MKKGQWPRMLFGLIAVFVLFQWIASALESVRGETGVLVGLIVVAATLLTERLLFRESFKEAAKAIGLGRPKRFGILAATTVGALLLLMVPLFLLQSGSSFSFYPGWLSLLPGLFFQAGIAEETLFRGYLFGHIRQRHTFWKAAAFAAIPFVLVHLILFYSLPWSLAGASILLAIAMSFPLSKLYEMGGDTMWAPAIVHFVAQGAVKVIVITGESAWMFPFFWIAISALIPLTVYVFPVLVKFASRKRLRTAVVRTGLVILLAATVVHAQDKSQSQNDFSSREELTGDWNGKRTQLREKGVDLKFRLTQFYQGVAAGGLDRNGAYSGKLDSHFRFDLEKLAGWKGFTVQIKTETRFGRTPSAGNGLPLNSAVISPESSGTAFSVTALNFTKLIPIGDNSNSIAIGGGKYYSLDSSREPFTGGAGVTRFIGLASNGNPAVGQTVPTVANGATFAWIRKGSPFLTFAVFDPVSSPTKPQIKRFLRQGVTFVPAISLQTKLGGKSGRHSFSGTITTREFTPFDQLVQFIVPGQPQVPVVPRGGSWSLTYTFNQYIHEITGQDGKRNGWGLFGTFSAADETTNPVGSFMTFGLGGNGLFRKRQRDQFGVAYGFAGVSNKLRSAIDPVLGVRNEHTFEAFYNYSITPWLWLTADLQIVRPVLQIVKTSIIPASRLVVHF